MTKRTNKSNIVKQGVALLALSVALTGGAAYAAPNDAPAAVQAQAPTAQKDIQITVNGKAAALHGFQLYDGKEAMLPLRAVAEALGFTLTWNQEDLSVDLSKDAIWTKVKNGEDRYTINKMYKPLGTAPALVDNTMYIPASFVQEVLRANVVTEGGTVAITEQKKQQHVNATGVITAIRDANGHKAVQINGVAMDGLVLNVSDETAYQTADGAPLKFTDLVLGMKVEVEHSLAATLSLPPQTPTFKITVLDKAEAKDVIGTAGTIEEVRTDDKGAVSVRIKGTGLTETSPSEVVLRLSEQSVLTDLKGEAIDKATLVQGAKVIGFYDGVLTRSLPPIGTAWKIVLQAQAE
ncbi:copper amine oxidase N-terminal domain-containing protein [Paenibacillus sp. H1-7]|nr:copper amine oxidase N-terminal domain-containing protein [Paenibacillus sp. H1-7]